MVVAIASDGNYCPGSFLHSYMSRMKQARECYVSSVVCLVTWGFVVAV